MNSSSGMLQRRSAPRLRRSRISSPCSASSGPPGATIACAATPGDSRFICAALASTHPLISNARVQIGVTEIDHQVHQDEARGDEKYVDLDQRIIAVGDRLDEQLPGAGPGKDRLDDDRP